MAQREGVGYLPSLCFQLHPHHELLEQVPLGSGVGPSQDFPHLHQHSLQRFHRDRQALRLLAALQELQLGLQELPLGLLLQEPAAGAGCTELLSQVEQAVNGLVEFLKATAIASAASISLKATSSRSVSSDQCSVCIAMRLAALLLGATVSSRASRCSFMAALSG